MSEKEIEDFIGEALGGDAQKNALEFAVYLRTNEMQFEKCGGYWEDKLYWATTYKGESVCYILISDEEKQNPYSWTVWSDDNGSDWLEDFPLGENMKEIVWNNLVICEKVNRCFDGCARKSKIIFGKNFDNVCGTAVKFENPNAETVACMKAVFNARKNYIIDNRAN